MDPQQAVIAKDFDSYRDSYEDTVNRAIKFSPFQVDYFVRAKAAHLRATVDRHFGFDTELSILDIGCGVGQYHPLIGDRFVSVTGVDVSSQAIERARQANPDTNYYSYDGNRLPFEDDTFDVAFAACVLHHVPVAAWPNFVREMRRVVRPGGLCLLFEHNPRNPLTMKAVNDCPFDADAVLLPPARSLALFREAGFTATTVEHILTIPAIDGFPKFLDRILSKIHFGTQYCLEAT